MDMETIHRIREHNEAEDDRMMPTIGPVSALAMILFVAFFWLCAWHGFNPAAVSIARAIQWFGQPLAEVLR